MDWIVSNWKQCGNGPGSGIHDEGQRLGREGRRTMTLNKQQKAKVLKGLEKEEREMENHVWILTEVYATGEVDEVKRERQEGDTTETKREKDKNIMKALRRLHERAGHPDKAKMIRLLMDGGASERAVEIARTFECAQCEEERGPKEPGKAILKVAKTFNEVVGMDSITVPKRWGYRQDRKGRVKYEMNKKTTMVNMIDRATARQVVRETCTAGSEQTWRAFRDGWIEPYGAPVEIRVDPGKEFEGSFKEGVEREAIRMNMTAKEAPWQNGHAERADGTRVATQGKLPLNTLKRIITKRKQIREISRPIKQRRLCLNGLMGHIKCAMFNVPLRPYNVCNVL